MAKYADVARPFAEELKGFTMRQPDSMDNTIREAYIKELGRIAAMVFGYGTSDLNWIVDESYTELADKLERSSLRDKEVPPHKARLVRERAGTYRIDGPAVSPASAEVKARFVMHDILQAEAVI